MPPAFQSNKQDNWFSRTLERKGSDYITSGRLTQDEVSRNAERIIDDIIRGHIDYTKYGNCMIEPVILDTLINYCTNKLAIESAIQYALGYTYNAYNNHQIVCVQDTLPQQYAMYDQMNMPYVDDATINNIAQAISMNNRDIAIHSTLLQALRSVSITKNPFELYALTSKLNYYTKNAYKRF